MVRKGIVLLKFNVHGIAAHSASCTQGANAVTEAAHKIIELEKLKNDDGITCNCGVITGGTVPNAVAAECSFFADIRFKDKEEFDKAIEIVHNVADNTTIDGCCCDVEQVSYRPAMPLTDVNIMLLDKINAIFKYFVISKRKISVCLFFVLFKNNEILYTKNIIKNIKEMQKNV